MIGLDRPLDEPGHLEATRTSNGDWAALPKASLREALRVLQQGRCAYCEALLPSDFVVDHFHPQDAAAAVCVDGNLPDEDNWSLTWSNLFAVCDRGSPPRKSQQSSACSALKRNADICDRAYRPTDLVGRQYDVDPTGMLAPRTADHKLQTTVAALRLDRREISIARKAVCEYVQTFVGHHGLEEAMAVLPGNEGPLITAILSELTLLGTDH